MAARAVASATGSILNKLEVIINFFQVYGLVLSLDLDIKWPDLWLDFSELYVGGRAPWSALGMDTRHGVHWT